MAGKSRQWSGRCLCGQVQFSWQGPSLWCAHCHCTRCQRAHGAAFVTWVGVEQSHFYLDRGEPKWHQSGAGSKRGFCANCGSSMFFQSDRWPGEMHIARALVEEPIDLTPQIHAFADTAVDWTQADPHLPRKAAGSDSDS